MKKIFFFFLLLVAKLSEGMTVEINPLVTNAFKQIFPKAQNIHWKEGNDKSIASFRLNKIAVIAIFDQTGNLLRMQKTYSKEYLPLLLLNELNKKFTAMQIYGSVIEVSSSDYKIYEITLKDKAYWYKIWS